MQYTAQYLLAMYRPTTYTGILKKPQMREIWKYLLLKCFRNTSSAHEYSIEVVYEEVMLMLISYQRQLYQVSTQGEAHWMLKNFEIQLDDIEIENLA